MSQSTEPPSKPGLGHPLARPLQVLVVTSVMLTFISYWRTAAVVLCDLASTAYYIGGIVEQAIGPAAPWFILAVMIFSYAVRSVYIESCSLFVRGGVYRVVREALGGTTAKLAVSALLFDYVLTGPISGVSAGKYIVGLLLEAVAHNPIAPVAISEAWRLGLMNWGAVVIACAVCVFFYRRNIIGLHESSGWALKIMIVTTVMAVIIVGWCLLTIFVAPAVDPSAPAAQWGNLTSPPVLAEAHPDPLGFIGRYFPEVAAPLREPNSWWQGLGLIGVIGLFIAFGHSILAMSGEETLAQVYREVEAPKLQNFKKAAFIVFLFSLFFTGLISFLAVLIIPNDVRMALYSENLIGGLAMNLWGPPLLLLVVNACVVIVGSFILAGAVNTSIIGSNGVLNRVAEDGVMPDWFLRPHPKYGTTYRVLRLILVLQLVTIVASGGNIFLLGEAYAFGVVWSFVFQALSMTILRFTNPQPREYKVPLNLKLGGVEVPVGLLLVLVILLITAVVNLLTKEVATVGGLIFTGVFFLMFTITERFHKKHKAGGKHEHLEQFNKMTTEGLSVAALGLTRPYRKLVAIRSPNNLFMLEKALAETDPETTDVIVMTAKQLPKGETPTRTEMDTYDQQLMTAVVSRAEQAGKEVKPVIVPTNNPLHAVMQTARDLGVQELVMGASNKFTADEQRDQISFLWIAVSGGDVRPLTVRFLNRQWDISFDLAGGNRIPKISERKARTVAELRAAGVGIDRVLLTHDGTPASSDLFQGVLTMLDASVSLGVVPLIDPRSGGGLAVVHQDRERALQLEREVHLEPSGDGSGAEVVRLAQDGKYDLIIVALAPEAHRELATLVNERVDHILRYAHCRVFLAAAPAIPDEVVDTNPSVR